MWSCSRALACTEFTNLLVHVMHTYRGSLIPAGCPQNVATATATATATACESLHLNLYLAADSESESESESVESKCYRFS